MCRDPRLGARWRRGRRDGDAMDIPEAHHGNLPRYEVQGEGGLSSGRPLRNDTTYKGLQKMVIRARTVVRGMWERESLRRRVSGVW